MRNVVSFGFQPPVSNSQARWHCFFTTIFLLLLMTFPSLLQAQFNYTITTNLTVMITKYTGTDHSVSIPSTISGLPVSSIANWAFAGSGVTNITLPYTLTNIGDPGYAFGNCWSLLAINADANNPYYSSVGGVLLDKSQSIVIQYPYGKIGSYTIPDTVTNVGGASFANCTLVSSITIPDSVITIGPSALYGCLGLTNASLGSNLTTIANAAFLGCSSLTNLTIPHSVTNIGTGAFSGCGSLSDIIIPNSVKTMGDDAFSQSGLKSITMSDHITSIGINTFSFCGNLISVTIPDSVTSLADWAFYECSALTNVALGKGVTVIGPHAFDTCTSLRNIMIPDNVSNIGPSAFAGCTSLAELTMGNGVSTIGASAFEGCIGLTGIIIPKSVSNIDQNAFANTSLTGVYFEGSPPVADSTVFNNDNISIIYYLPRSPGWGPVFANRPAVPWLPQIISGDSAFGVRNNIFGFNVFWASGTSVVVEGSKELAKSVWVPLATNNLTSSLLYFTDPQWTNYPARFYRVHSL